jgi:hypothetical protein
MTLNKSFILAAVVVASLAACSKTEQAAAPAANAPAAGAVSAGKTLAAIKARDQVASTPAWPVLQQQILPANGPEWMSMSAAHWQRRY